MWECWKTGTALLLEPPLGGSDTLLKRLKYSRETWLIKESLRNQPTASNLPCFAKSGKHQVLNESSDELR